MDNKELTPFQKAGYTEDTKFRVLCKYCMFEKGDIVKLYWDDGSDCPRFHKIDDPLVRHHTCLPGMSPTGREKLEVIQSGEEGVDRKHPLQKFRFDQGYPRFVENRLVKHLVSAYGLNNLSVEFDSEDDEYREDWGQLAQLIGYSLNGFCELSYVSDETYDLAVEEAEKQSANSIIG